MKLRKSEKGFTSSRRWTCCFCGCLTCCYPQWVVCQSGLDHDDQEEPGPGVSLTTPRRQPGVCGPVWPSLRPATRRLRRGRMALLVQGNESKTADSVAVLSFAEVVLVDSLVVARVWSLVASCPFAGVVLRRVPGRDINTGPLRSWHGSSSASSSLVTAPGPGAR